MKFIQRLTARIPQEIPRSAESLTAFIQEAIQIYDLPTDLSYQRAAVSMVLQLPPSVYKVSKYHVSQSIKRAEATHAAYMKIQDLKKEEDNLKQAATPKPESPPEANQSADQGVGSTA